MSTTLNYGIVRPEDGDRGSTFWDDLADFITQMADHDHDGANSATLDTGSLTSFTSSIIVGDWGNLTDGVYRATVNCPSGVNTTDFIMKFKDSSGNILYLHSVKIDSSSFYVYSNNSVAVTVFYLK